MREVLVKANELEYKQGLDQINLLEIDVPHYWLTLTVRATGGFRLPVPEVRVDNVQLISKSNEEYKAKIEGLVAESAQAAYDESKIVIFDLLRYLALLGDDAAFGLITEVGHVACRNMNLEAEPVPASLPAPKFESINGVVPDEGQEILGQQIDPDESKRRTGVVLVHHATAAVLPGKDRFDELCRFFLLRSTTPKRLQLALSVLYDATFAKEYANAFAQTYTALEILFSHLRPSATILKTVMKRTNGLNKGDKKRTAEFKQDFFNFLDRWGYQPREALRSFEYMNGARSVSDVDIVMLYFKNLGLEVVKEDVRSWQRIRGKFVHSHEVEEGEVASMKLCRKVVREAMVLELRALHDNDLS